MYPDPESQSTTDGPSHLVGTSIGPYRLLQTIGEGGFGAVYMAEQARPVKRKVALKVIKPGMDSKAVFARFEGERQALAMMDHPNIAKVLDGGSTKEERPYFVMELVRGVRITTYCDDNKLSITERLGLFSSVCEAVQHAHQKGVIHRDLKPSNVMVTLHDGKPVVKVIDFGVAKAMHSQLTEKTLFTAYGQMIGTPQYMSPEQAEVSGLDIDTRSDIYSLAVLLYELLTGTTPLESKQLRAAGVGGIHNLIKETEPPKPSTRVSSAGDQLTHIAEHRSVEPDELRREISGDLDWIVMKGLEKDRNRRYETASSFAADIERFLNDEAVSACPPSMNYHVRKFVRRNRNAVIAATALFLTLCLGLAGTTFGLVRAQHEADRARQAEISANHQRERADKARLAEARQREHGRQLLYTSDMERAQTAFSFSPDGKSLASGSGDRTVKIWDLAVPGQFQLIDSYTDWVESVAFSPNSKFVATASIDSKVSLWSTEKREFEWRRDDVRYVQDVAFSPDGKTLASVSSGSPQLGATKGIKLWSCQEPGEMRQWMGHSSAIHAVAYLDINTVASAGSDNTVRLWDAANGKSLGTMKGHSGSVQCIAFSRNRLLLASASIDHTVKLWEVKKHDEDSVLLGHVGSIAAVALSPDGSTVASAADDTTVKLWDARTGKLKHNLDAHADGVICLTFSPDGRTLASSGEDAMIVLWDTTTGQSIRELSGGHSDTVWALTFLHDGTSLLSTGEDGAVRLWNSTTGDHRTLLEIPYKLGCMALSRNNKLAIGAWDDYFIELLDLDNPAWRRTLRGHLGPIRTVEFLRSGSQLVSGSRDGTVRLWDAQTGGQAKILARHTDQIESVALSPDGTTLASGGSAGVVKLFDMKTRRERATLKGHSGPVKSLAFSHDGKLLVSGGSDRSVRLWRAASEEEVNSISIRGVPSTEIRR